MSCKLTYFNDRRRGELSRLLFACSGTKFDDKRIEFSEWGELKPKTPLRSLPILEVEGKELVQSLSIARYLANKFGLAGKTDLDKAIADGIVTTTEDLRQELMPVLFEKDDAARTQKLKDFNEKADFKMNFFENKLIESEKAASKGSDKGYFVGTGITWADLAVFDIFFTLLSFDSSALQPYPKLQEHQGKIGNLPKIKAYVDKRPTTPF